MRTKVGWLRIAAVLLAFAVLTTIGGHLRQLDSLAWIGVGRLIDTVGNGLLWWHVFLADIK